MQKIDLTEERLKLSQLSELWQFDLLTPEKLVQLAKEKGLSFCNPNAIRALWQIGLLRADMIFASKKIEMPFLIPITNSNREFAYCDVRQVAHKKDGYASSFPSKEQQIEDLELFFHPFRLFVLYHLRRVFKTNMVWYQFLLNSTGVFRVQDVEVKCLEKWTAEEKFVERFEHWNQTSELAILLEPFAYQKIFHSIRWRFPDNEESIAEKRSKNQNDIYKILGKIGIDEINSIMGETCWEANCLDSNKTIHVLLRHMNSQIRKNLKGRIGACILFLCMAETIRRCAEKKFGIDFKEEDELGFGTWFDGARKSLYGTERITDAPPEIRRNFLTSLGIESGTTVRCYVEGETEEGALNFLAENYGKIEVVNLRGQFIQKNQLNFVSSLQNDMKTQTYSVVMLDMDRVDNVRVLKKAVENNQFFGRFFLYNPDFEFANFTISELVEVVVKLLRDQAGSSPEANELLRLVEEANGAKDFFSKINSVVGSVVFKGHLWGAELMEYALKLPNIPSGHKDYEVKEKDRPLVEAVKFILRARDIGYAESANEYMVDSASGKLKKRKG